MENLLCFEVKGNTLTRRDVNRLIAYTRNNSFARFLFDSSWDNVTPIVAQFKRDDENAYDVFIVDGKCAIPWEVLDGGGILSVVVTGGDLLITNCVKINIYSSGLVGGLLATEASPGLYTNLTERVDTLENDIETKAEKTDVENLETEVKTKVAKENTDGLVMYAENATMSIKLEKNEGIEILSTDVNNKAEVKVYTLYNTSTNVFGNTINKYNGFKIADDTDFIFGHWKWTSTDDISVVGGGGSNELINGIMDTGTQMDIASKSTAIKIKNSAGSYIELLNDKLNIGASGADSNWTLGGLILTLTKNLAITVQGSISILTEQAKKVLIGNANSSMEFRSQDNYIKVKGNLRGNGSSYSIEDFGVISTKDITATNVTATSTISQNVTLPQKNTVETVYSVSSTTDAYVECVIQPNGLSSLITTTSASTMDTLIITFSDGTNITLYGVIALDKDTDGIYKINNTTAVTDVQQEALTQKIITKIMGHIDIPQITPTPFMVSYTKVHTEIDVRDTLEELLSRIEALEG